MNYRPIETLTDEQKDGRDVLLCWRLDATPGRPARWRFTVARWFEPWGNWLDGEFPEDPVNDEYYGIGEGVPSHWAPLTHP